MDGTLIINDDEISKELNKYFLFVFSQEESDRDLEPVQICKGQEVDKLSDIVVSREVVSREIDRLMKTKSPEGTIFFRGFLRNVEKSSLNPLR